MLIATFVWVKMKIVRSLYTAIILLAVLSLVLIGCQEEDIDSTTGGGQQTDLAAKFIGTWNVDDQPARINYQVKIERHPVYADLIRLVNFGDAGGTAVGNIVGNTILLDKQLIGSGFYAEGTGTFINNKRLQFEFVLDDGIDAESRKAVFTK